ncbi:MAG: nucleotidyltransferase domain-containing protein [Gammaproteobacteria bacterium]|nr:nucleotidyltransferase domain-containing protein [Gammaproteobacteria bacterium]
MSRLSNALFTTTQQKVLTLLFTQPDKSFYVKEILRLTGMGVATIKRELDRMRTAGILRMTKIGNQHHYQANRECPIFRELSGIVKKTSGITGSISSALTSLSGKIEWAFIYGSIAAGNETTGSDIDLMIIGDTGFSEVVSLLNPVQEILGREINPKIYGRKEWILMKTSKNAFVNELLSKPRMDVMGDNHGLG